tara:strand:+ start:145 stop:792 length:648 start_codon:yes stop_codon:yes gene_type:complete
MISKPFLLWIIPKKNSPKYLTKEELASAKELLNPKKNKFLHSRSYIREVLSELLGINPLNIPLDGVFGKIPSIPPEFGYISLSHCENALLIGWSTEKIGVDIERKNRNFDANKIMKRCYCNDEINELNMIKNKDKLRKAVMKLWVLKESSIKLQQGSIARDLLNWQINLSEKIAINKITKLKLNSYCFEYKDWYLGTASQNIKIKELDTVICDMF